MSEKQTKPKAEKQTKPKAEKQDGVGFVYVGPLDETKCYSTKFVKGEASIVTSELGIKKLSKHPHFEKQ